MAEQPGGSNKDTCGEPRDWKAVYRFLASEAFGSADLEAALHQACRERCSGANLVVAIRDTTELSVSSSRAGVGAADQLCVHSVLAVSREGVPWGLLHQQRWTRPADGPATRALGRPHPGAEKESYRWLEGSRAVEQLLPAGTRVLTVADRQADLVELLALSRPDNSQLLIRATGKRKVDSPERHLWLALRATACAGVTYVPVRRKSGRSVREARVEVRFQALELPLPQRGRHEPGRGAPRVTAIYVREAGGPPHPAPVDWLLLTTLPVATPARACECVRYYALHGLIERYHYLLKSGCKLEGSGLLTAGAWERRGALCSARAWRLLWLTHEARRDGAQPCTVALTRAEWQALWHLIRGEAEAWPDSAPPVGEMVRWLGWLGGFTDRGGEGEPGVNALWRGLSRVQEGLIGAEPSGSLGASGKV